MLRYIFIFWEIIKIVDTKLNIEDHSVNKCVCVFLTTELKIVYPTTSLFSTPSATFASSLSWRTSTMSIVVWKYFHCCFIGRVFQLNYQHLLLFVWNCFVDFAFFGKNKLNWITFKFNNCFIDWVSPLYLGIKSCVFFSVESFLLSILLICLGKKFLKKFLNNIFGLISVNKNFCLLHNLI